MSNWIRKVPHAMLLSLNSPVFTLSTIGSYGFTVWSGKFTPIKALWMAPWYCYPPLKSILSIKTDIRDLTEIPSMITILGKDVTSLSYMVTILMIAVWVQSEHAKHIVEDSVFSFIAHGWANFGAMSSLWLLSYLIHYVGIQGVLFGIPETIRKWWKSIKERAQMLSKN